MCCNKCDAVMLEHLQRRAARVVLKVNSSVVALTVFSGVLPAGNLLILTQNVSSAGNTAVRVVC